MHHNGINQTFVNGDLGVFVVVANNARKNSLVCYFVRMEL